MFRLSVLKSKLKSTSWTYFLSVNRALTKNNGFILNILITVKGDYFTLFFLKRDIYSGRGVYWEKYCKPKYAVFSCLRLHKTPKRKFAVMAVHFFQIVIQIGLVFHFR